MHGTLPVRSTYKTPLELGFSQEEFDALAWFVDQYDKGRVVDLEVPPGLFDKVIVPTDFVPDKFRMSAVGTITDCGTAGCILGYVMHRIEDAVWHEWPKQIRFLFYDYLRYKKPVKAADARDATVRVLRGELAWP